MWNKPRFLLASLYACSIFLLLAACSGNPKDTGPRRMELLMLGHLSKHHDSEKLADILSQEYFKMGMNITYTVSLDDLNDETLEKYDGLILYANHDTISPSQAKSLLNFVENGGGFIPLHSASYCFRNSPEVVELIGGQFKSHKYDSFPTVTIKPEHPVMQGLEPFYSWDETYVHDKISPNIEVLAERVEGEHREPYTWVKEHGKGRVFYTAYGHNEKTFLNQGFLDLVRNGILWAVGDEAVARMKEYAIAQPTYRPENLPNYERRDPAPEYQLPLTAEESMTLIQVPVDFELELFAAEPDIAKPIAMAWDEKGRLWIVETVDYPNTVREEDGVGDDRIKICEDTDGDGKADNFTIFADNLNIPTSLTFANGGVIVSQAPHFVFLKDTDGDDKADVRENIITGWGTYDTHAGPSNLKYGFNNRVWGTVGYSGFRGPIGAGTDTMRFGQGIYHFSPDGKSLEFMGSTSNNTWGLGFTEENDVFASTANNTHSAFLALPKSMFDRAGLSEERGIEKIDGHYNMHVSTKNLRQVDVHGGFTAAAGHNFYTARNFPEEYWNKIAFICEPTGRVVHKHKVIQDGSGFKEDVDGWNIMNSADEWMGPVHAEVGPDGHLWVADWYNFIIQHNPTPQGRENGPGNAYIDPLRDNTRGRIYKIKYKKGNNPKPLKLNREKPGQLVDALENDNLFWRMTAQRLLVEEGHKDAASDLISLLKSAKTDKAGINPTAIHAIWTLHGLGQLDGSNEDAVKAVTEALKHPVAGVRKAALQALPPNEATLKSIMEAKLLEDGDFRVRLYSLIALAEMPASEELGKVLYGMTGDEANQNDKWVNKALFITAGTHRDGFMAAYTAAGGTMEVPASGKLNLSQRVAMGSRLKSLPLFKWANIRPDRAPDPVGKEILFSSTIELNRNGDKHGVIMAQGNKTNGYSVYLLPDMKVYFQVNNAGKSYILSSPEAVKGNKFNVSARLQPNGQMNLLIDDKEVATLKTPGNFTKPFTQGLRVGADNARNEPAGNYVTGYKKGVTDQRGSGRGQGNLPDARLGGNLENAWLEMIGADAGSELANAKVDQTIDLKVVLNVMKYDKETLTAKAGTVVEIVFENPDFMQHNLLILKPGSMERVGAAADRMAQDPSGAAKNYIPELPDVLAATRLVDPEQTVKLRFRVPDVPGDYPYVCTFPGHWRIMNGILKVTR